MRYRDFLKDQFICIITHIISMICCVVFLSSVNIYEGIIVILITAWVLILIFYINIHYYFRNRYFKKLLFQLNNLDKKYLFAELMDVPEQAEDRIVYDILKTTSKSMIEQISLSKRERKEYKEYIEQWIHDVKTPIAAIRLLCENNKTDLTRKLMVELEKISHFTDQALYYARSENVEKDYLIKEVVLSDIIHAAIAENKQLLIQNHISVHIKNCQYSIYTDEKWIGFIINQIITNAVKYSGKEPSLTFYAYAEQSSISLCISDNGVGISEDDLPRIFDKGFTGENGRNVKCSTGIGLYLCKRLCTKLGISITAQSKPGKGTTMKVSFPKGDFVKVQE